MVAVLVAVAYMGWSFNRVSSCKASTGKFLVFWIGGRLWEVVAYEVRPYVTLIRRGTPYNDLYGEAPPEGFRYMKG